MVGMEAPGVLGFSGGRSEMLQMLRMLKLWRDLLLV